jgi:hypothetical protein
VENNDEGRRVRDQHISEADKLDGGLRIREELECDEPPSAADKTTTVQSKRKRRCISEEAVAPWQSSRLATAAYPSSAGLDVRLAEKQVGDDSPSFSNENPSKETPSASRLHC